MVERSPTLRNIGIRLDSEDVGTYSADILNNRPWRATAPGVNLNFVAVFISAKRILAESRRGSEPAIPVVVGGGPESRAPTRTNVFSLGCLVTLICDLCKGDMEVT